MSEYKTLAIVTAFEKHTVDLSSTEFHHTEIKLTQGKAILALGALDFYKLFLSMLQEVQGYTLANHMPSHGLSSGELDEDMLEAIIVNMLRIEEELKECGDWHNRFTAVVARRMAETRGLRNPSDT